MTVHRILFVLTSHEQLGDTGQATGAYLPELAHPWKVFAEAGYLMDITTPKGGAAPFYGVDASDPVQSEFLGDFAIAVKTLNTLHPDRIEAHRYQAIFYVGGHGAMWDLPDNTAIASAARIIYEGGGVVAAVCHGPAGLLNITLSDGHLLVHDKQVTSFTNSEEAAVGLDDVVPFLLAPALERRGAIHLPGPDFAPQTVIDGRLITGQNPSSAVGVAECVVKTLDVA